MTKHVADMLTGLFRNGPYTCSAGCGSELVLPGCCDECAAKERDAEQLRRVKRALRSIPRRFDWAVFGNPLLRVGRKEDGCWVKPMRSGKDPVAWCEGLAGVLSSQQNSGTAFNVVLRGSTGVGKSALAAALLREFARLAPALGERCWWQSVVDLSVARRDSRFGEKPLEIAKSRSASILVLDDLCQEEGGIAVVVEVLHARHDRNLPTIITTWANNSEIIERYGGGTWRRGIDDWSIVIDWSDDPGSKS